MQKTIIKIDESCEHDLVLNKYVITQQKPGPNVYIQASVHGAELQGSLVIKELIEQLKNKTINGRITLIPIANPYATSQKVGTSTFGRFSPISGDNWNRLYYNIITKEKETPSTINIDNFCKNNKDKSEAEIIKLFKKEISTKIESFIKEQDDYGISDGKMLFCTLQNLASDADIVLDLHTGPVATRYLYAQEHLKEKSKDLNSPYTLLIPSEFGGAMDEACFYPWHCLKQKLIELGKTFNYEFESYTVELGSEEIVSLAEAKIDANNILNLLFKRGVLNEAQVIKENEKEYCLLKNYKTYRAKSSGLCEYLKSPGEKFKKGDILATIHSFNNLDKDYSNQSSNIVAITDGIVINHIPSANIKKGMDLIQCFSY